MEQFSTITHLLFDLDGTLTNPKEGITKSIQYALKKFEIHIDDRDTLIPFIGPPLLDSFRDVYGFSEEDAKQAIEYYREYFVDQGMFENDLYSEIETTLSVLKSKGYRLCVATSKPTIFAEKILKHFDLAQYFEFIVGSHLDHTRQNKDEIIMECLQKWGHPTKTSCVMIGDREHDIVGAKKVGIKTIGVLYGYGSKKELSAAGADHLISDHSEILEL